jgi:hypothetical protein
VGPLGVADAVERVDLGLQVGQAGGEGLLVEVAEQGLVEALVLTLGGRLVRLAGDGLDAQRGDVLDELAQVSAARGVECQPVSDRSRCGTPCTASALSNTTIAASTVSPAATWDATA